MKSLWNRLTRRSRPAAPAAPPAAAPAPAPTRSATRAPAAPTPTPRTPAARRRPVPGPPPQRTASVHAEAPTGAHLSYAPTLDGDADPGEIVWTWVPYEDDPSQGKDRPVLIVGREGRVVLGLMLSSQSERDGQRNWLALGPGAWDHDARPSWLRLDRVLRMPEDSIRREGAVLDKPRFVRVADILRRSYGWR